MLYIRTSHLPTHSKKLKGAGSDVYNLLPAPFCLYTTPENLKVTVSAKDNGLVINTKPVFDVLREKILFQLTINGH